MDEELREVRALAHEFAEAELRPNVEAWDRERRLDPAVLGQLAELGFFGMLVPEPYGGMDFGPPAFAAVLEELAWGEPAVALILSVHGACVAAPIARHGSEEQKRRWLGPLARGEVMGACSLAGPAADAAAAAIGTHATRDGEDWALSGTEPWVAMAPAAGLVLVPARAGESLATFLVPSDAAGFEVVTVERTLGLRPLEIAHVELRDVRLGGDALLGGPAGGLRVLGEALDLARLAAAAQAVGIARAALEYAAAYAAEREQFGRKLREFQGLQFKLADMATRVEAARAVTASAAATPSARRAAVAKLFASEAAMWVTTQAVQVYGGYGYMRDYPVEKLMRDAKATEIYEGTNETLRVLVARELYGS